MSEIFSLDKLILTKDTLYSPRQLSSCFRDPQAGYNTEVLYWSQEKTQNKISLFY